MQTEIVTVSMDSAACGDEEAAYQRAVAVLRSGGLVAFPTETVYGLGADALNPSAVEKIFAAKGRPATNPLIVHVAEISQIPPLVLDWSDVAKHLANKFWPGPLTLVLPKSQLVPDIVTAGGPTVAIRIPAHQAAQKLLKATNLPLAAPSANRSQSISPTTAEHVRKSLDGRLELILDAGPTSGGIESTVLDATQDPVLLLRPGLLSIEEIEREIGTIQTQDHTSNASEVARSPGQQQRHYAPFTRLTLLQDNAAASLHCLGQTKKGLRVGWIAFGEANPTDATKTISMPTTTAQYAREIYSVLHSFDAESLDEIVVTQPPRSHEWFAIHDRLQRAASTAKEERQV